MEHSGPDDEQVGIDEIFALVTASIEMIKSSQEVIGGMQNNLRDIFELIRTQDNRLDMQSARIDRLERRIVELEGYDDGSG